MSLQERVTYLERQRKVLTFFLLFFFGTFLFTALVPPPPCPLRAPLPLPLPAPLPALAPAPAPAPACAACDEAALSLSACRARAAQLERARAAAARASPPACSPAPTGPQPFFTSPLSLFVGILSQSGEGGARERGAVRATTLQLLHRVLQGRRGGGWQVAHKFFVTLPPAGTAQAEALQREALAMGDMVLLPDAPRWQPPRADRRTLTQRVHEIFAWAARENATWVLKTDTDSYVHYGALLEELARAPRERWSWGRRGGPLESPDFPSDGLGPALAPYFAAATSQGTPFYYLSGWGYVLSVDLVADAAARPFAHMMDCEYYEDICTGLRVLPYAPAQVNDARFCQDPAQWGYPTTLCQEGLGVTATVLRHHVGPERMHQLHEHFSAYDA